MSQKTRFGQVGVCTLIHRYSGTETLETMGRHKGPLNRCYKAQTKEGRYKVSASPTESCSALSSPETHQATSCCVCSETCHRDVLDDLGMWWLAIRVTVCSKPRAVATDWCFSFRSQGQAEIAKEICIAGESTSHIGTWEGDGS